MSEAIFKKTYFYNAHAHGLSARFERPVEHMIEVQAATSLPTTGGHGNARVSKFKFQEFVSYETAYSHVSGSQNKADASYTTLVTATIEGLNILDVVTADRIVARMSSQHPGEHHEPHIVFLGSRFDNLRIAGCPVETELNHDLFLRLDTFAAIRKELESNNDFRKMAEDPYQTGQAQKLPDANGVLLCSLVKTMKVNCPGVTRHGHVFHVPQFGNIFMGEILAKHGIRTLTMLRLEMGSPVQATANVAETVVNGQTWP
jgi:hypothetical protein